MACLQWRPSSRPALPERREISTSVLSGDGNCRAGHPGCASSNAEGRIFCDFFVIFLYFF